MNSTWTGGLPRFPSPTFLGGNGNSTPNLERGVRFFRKFSVYRSTKKSDADYVRIAAAAAPAVASDVAAGIADDNPALERLETVEVTVEKVIFGCRFFAILAVCGSLVGSFLCFFKGCVYVATSFRDYFLFLDRGKVISTLVEATDVYLLGTVMLVFGMGLYELFISNLDKFKSMSDGSRSNLFGLFTLKERPRWLEVKSVNELKTKLGHVIVMLLLIGLFDKSKRAAITSPADLLCFSASILFSAGSLFHWTGMMNWLESVDF